MARSTRPFVSPEAAPGCTDGFMLCPLVSPEANADMLRAMMKPVSVLVLVPVRVRVRVVSCGLVVVLLRAALGVDYLEWSGRSGLIDRWGGSGL